MRKSACLILDDKNLLERAIEALLGNPGIPIPQQLPVMIHSDIVNACHLSPRDKHFSDVKVLGMDFLSKNKLSLSMNYDANLFQLTL